MPRAISLDSDVLAEAAAYVAGQSKVIDWEGMYHREVADHAHTKSLLADARTRIEVLESEVSELRATVAMLVAELHGKHPATSQNSSSPPSMDRRRHKRAMPQPSTKKPGGQPGHPGVTRDFTTPTQVIDHYEDGVHTEAVSVDALEVGETRGEWVLAERRQVIDVRIETVVTEHRLWRRREETGSDRALSATLFPAEASAPVAFHPHVRAMALFLGQSVTVPDRWVAKTISELCGIELATATFQSWKSAASDQLDEVIDAIRAGVLAEEVLCMDETTIRVNKDTTYLHVAASDRFSLFHVAGRSTEGCAAGGVLKNFTGTMVSDCYSPYWSNPNVTHQRCNAHLLRDLQKVIDDFEGVSVDPASWARDLQSQVLATKHKLEGAKGGVLTPRQYALARGAMVRLAGAGLAAHPKPASRKTRRYTIDKDARALAKRIVNFVDEYLTYTRDPQVPFTNNLAEQAVRHAKVRQRRSGTHRSLEAAHEYARIRSYLETGRKQGQDSARILEALAAGQPWVPPVAATLTR